MQTGLFIALEGIGGVGKSTVYKKIAEFLKGASIPFVETREPGGTDCAEHLRTLVKQGFPNTEEKMDAMGVALLFNAARADNVAKVITPALDSGRWVLCDRFSDTTLVYQSVYNGVRRSRLEALHDLVIGMDPTVTFLLDAPAKVANTRIHPEAKDGDQFDQASLEMQERMRQVYLSLAAEEPWRYHVIDATQSEEQVFAQILPHLMRLHSDWVKRPDTKCGGIRSTLVG